MAGEWTLIEYRPGRFAKISTTGEFLGRASEAEARAWFAARGAPLDALLQDESESLSPLPQRMQEVEGESPEATLEDEHDLWPAGDLAVPREAELLSPEPLAETATLHVEEWKREVQEAASGIPVDTNTLTGEQLSADLIEQTPFADPEVEAQAPDIEPEGELPQDLVGEADQADQEPATLLVEERDREAEEVASKAPVDPDTLTAEEPTAEQLWETPAAKPEFEVEAPVIRPVADLPQNLVGQLHQSDQEPVAGFVDAHVMSQSPASGIDHPAVEEKPAPDLVDAGSVSEVIVVATVEDETVQKASTQDSSDVEAEPPSPDAEPDEDEPGEEEWVEEPLALELESQLSWLELGDTEDDLEEDEPMPPAPVTRQARDTSRRSAHKAEPEPEHSVPGNGVGRWLWVDPRQERGYNPDSFDVAGFLQRAADLFRSKEWTAGQSPGRLAVHPDQITDSLSPAAEAQNLEVVPDPMVPRGTYRLGLPEVQE